MKTETKFRINKYLKLIFGTLAILAVFSAAGWYYFTTDRALKAKDTELRSMKNNTRDQLQTTLEIQDQKYLKLLMEPFGWAIRNELLKEDISTVHQYIAQFVKSSAVELVLVNNVDGKIISASDKKVEGKMFSEVYPDIQWKVTETQITATRTVTTRHIPLRIQVLVKLSIQGIHRALTRCSFLCSKTMAAQQRRMHCS